jgi:hypothetical protein
LSRGGVLFDGIGAHYTTFKLKTSDTIVEADQGKAVTPTANGEVGYGSSGGVFLGILERVEGDGYGSVQDGGYCEVEYASCALLPQLGKPVVVNGAGLVSQATTAIVGRSNCIVSVESLATANHKVVVLLG